MKKTCVKKELGRPVGSSIWEEASIARSISAPERFFKAWKDPEFKREIKKVLDLFTS